MILVLTSCTNRKRLTAPDRLTACTVRPGALEAVAKEWTERIAEADASVEAASLYCGRAFRQAEAAALRLNARLMIVSAGLGLVEAVTRVPPYSLTVVRGAADNILDRIWDKPSAADWWKALCRRTHLGVSLSEHLKGSRGPVLVALSAQYLAMIAPDLLALPEKTRRRLRIFSLSLPNVMPEGLRPYLMPYDARFDGAGSPLPGTRGDFAQRALSHFAHEILPCEDEDDIKGHADAVGRMLSGLQPPTPFARTKATDEEIIAIIHRHWSEVGGRSGRMLRYLRDDLGIACEQSRFKELFNAARDGRP